MGEMIREDASVTYWTGTQKHTPEHRINDKLDCGMGMKKKIPVHYIIIFIGSFK